MNGDRVVSPLDVLLMINDLNAAEPSDQNAGAEGEAARDGLVTRLGLVTHWSGDLRTAESPFGGRDTTASGDLRSVQCNGQETTAQRRAVQRFGERSTTVISESLGWDAELIELLALDVETVWTK